MLALDGVIQITERDEASYQVRRRAYRPRQRSPDPKATVCTAAAAATGDDCQPAALRPPQPDARRRHRRR
jgi:hypothetical protein